MASDWLYPLSINAGREFVDADGTSVAVSFDSYRDAVVEGRLDQDWWYIATNFRNADKGDRMWIYFGDQDIGVVGVATIHQREYHGEWEEWALEFKLHRQATRILLEHPFPAREVRHFVPYPRAPVVGLDAHPALVRQLEHWVDEAPRKSKLHLKELALAPRRTTTRRQLEATSVELAHDTVLAPIDTKLRAEGFDVGIPRVGAVLVDLVAVDDHSIVIVEAKTVGNDDSGRLAARQAFAQLHEYQWRIGRLNPDDKRRRVLWAAFDQRPDTEVVDFLEDHNVLVSWEQDPSGYRFARRSAQVWPARYGSK